MNEFLSNESEFLNKKVKTLPLEKQIVLDKIEISDSSILS